jgi:hypothetical protein
VSRHGALCTACSAMGMTMMTTTWTHNNEGTVWIIPPHLGCSCTWGQSECDANETMVASYERDHRLERDLLAVAQAEHRSSSVAAAQNENTSGLVSGHESSILLKAHRSCFTQNTGAIGLVKCTRRMHSKILFCSRCRSPSPEHVLMTVM